MNGKTMATLLEKTRCNTAYLRRHVEVSGDVGMRMEGDT